jgi:ATP-binding cassette subfamily C (CFTR/MRP) protein 4
MQALFRILEAEEGSIRIGNVDISRLGLHKLRTSISAIPQSPVLFSGCTVRESLDPFGRCDDGELLTALADVQMYDAIESLPQGLDTLVAEGGSNFSVGQRQLLCLARAVLLKNKILVLDEPTANVDTNTDKLLQKTLRENFSDATIISIAHRLDTIMDYDRVLVLGNSKVLEFGSPKELLGREGGHFASMVESTGETMAGLLREKAGLS